MELFARRDADFLDKMDKLRVKMDYSLTEWKTGRSKWVTARQNRRLEGLEGLQLAGMDDLAVKMGYSPSGCTLCRQNAHLFI